METKRDGKARAKAEKAYAKAQRPWYKKKRFLLPLLLILLIVIIVAVNGGDEDKDADTSGSNSQQEQPAAEDAQDEEPAGDEDAAEDAEPEFPGATDDDVVGQGGDELALGDIKVTASPIEAGDSQLGATICTTVAMTNGSDETVDFNAFDWSLQEPSGTISTTGFGGSDDQLSAGKIAPGGSTEGDVCFDGELEEGQYVVLYEPIFSFFSDRAAWVNDR